MSSMLVPTKSSSAVLVMIRSKFESICNHSRARLVDSIRNRTFSRGTQIWCARTEESLSLRGQALHRWNLRFMLNISYAGCPGLFWMVSANSVLKCVFQPVIANNSLKTPIFGVQGRSRSSVLAPLKSLSAVLVMISSKSVSICNRFHARWANSGKITISKEGTARWCPRSRGIPHAAAPKLPR